MNSKTALESKTIMYQVVSAMLVLILASSQIFSPFLSAEVLALVMFGVKLFDTGINVYLRLVTNQPIKKKGEL